MAKKQASLRALEVGLGTGGPLAHLQRIVAHTQQEPRDELKDLLLALFDTVVSRRRFAVDALLRVQLLPDGEITAGPADFDVGFLQYHVMTCLQQVGIDRLRRCPEPKCSRFFVKVTRKAYCSVTCQNRANSRKWYSEHVATGGRRKHAQAKR